MVKQIDSIARNMTSSGAKESRGKNVFGDKQSVGDRRNTPCVISLGVNADAPEGQPERVMQDYPRGLRRIEKDLRRHEFQGEFIKWDDGYPVGCPDPLKVPFGFKPFCFLEAMERGYRLVLWLDSSAIIVRPLNSLFDRIKKEGYLIIKEYHSLGEYCKDEALAPLGLTREESFQLPCCRSSMVGLNLEDRRGREFLHEWVRLANDGITFAGAKWSGVRGWPRTVSSDSRVKGHRHDQTAASAVALKLGMNDWMSTSDAEKYVCFERTYVRQYRDDINLSDRHGLSVVQGKIFTFCKRYFDGVKRRTIRMGQILGLIKK